MRKHVWLGCMMVVAMLGLGLNSMVQAQPLVTGGLSIYYDFDDFSDIIPDKSGNGLTGKVVMGGEDAKTDGLVDITNDKADKKRGAGSLWINGDSALENDDEFDKVGEADYINVCDTPNNLDVLFRDCAGGATVPANLLPRDGFTYAAWVKVEAGSDMGIWQSRADGGGFTHTQIQGGGRIRSTLRGDANSDNIVSRNVNLNGEETDDPEASVPRDEWFHVATTYNKGNDENAPGTYAIYYNGQMIDGGEANGAVAADPELGHLGNWGQGAQLGLVPDIARQFVGRMDEFYLFTRSLSADEIKTLYELKEAGIKGDFDKDGQLDLDDINALVGQSASGQNNAAYDVTGDNAVNGADVKVWVKDLKKTWIGDGNLDGEFNTTDFVDAFQAGKYEIDTAANWSEGDWSGNARFESGDFVEAFQDGGYEKGPVAAVSAVPEPSALVLAAIGLLAVVARRRQG